MPVHYKDDNGGGGGGTINAGTPPQHAYYSGATTLDSDSNQRKGTDGTELRAISFALVDSVTDQYYVATTGNDANPGTLAQPFLTIGRAMRQLNMNLRPGKIQINIANGTYDNTRFIVPDIITVDSDATYGQSVIRIVGNSAAPGNVVLNFDSSGIIWALNSQTTLVIDGCTITSDGLGSGTVGVKAINAAVYIRNCNFTDNRIGIFSGPGGLIVIESTANGGTIDAVDNSIIADGGQVIIQRDLTLQGSRDCGLLARNNGVIALLSGCNNITSGGTTCDNNLRAERGGVIIAVPAITYDLSDAASGIEAAAFKILSGGRIEIAESSTINITDASNAGFIQDASTWKDGGTCTFSYLGTTNDNWTISDNATVINDNEFSGATILNDTYVGSMYGLDWRYQMPVVNVVSGALPGGVTRYVIPNALDAGVVPTYVATANEVITYFGGVYQTGNGGGNTDTYTIVKNGVDQTMTFSISNSTTGSTTSNPVSLAAGDQVAVKVVTAAGTAAEDLTVQFLVRKTA